MASFLTLLSRYVSKKTKYVEKQKIKTEKEKKTKAKEFSKTYPTHDKQLKSWEKTYGEKKQKADAKFEGERKKRVMKARAMGPAGRQKKYRTASVYMTKDPFTKPPTKPRGSSKTTYLKGKAKQKNDFITKMNAPIKEELLKENTRMSMPPLRNISQSLIDAVKEAQQNQPASVDKPLDLSLKMSDNKQSIKEESIDEGLLKKASRFIDKVSGSQEKRLHDKVNKQMDDRQISLLGHLTKDHRDSETVKKDVNILLKDRRYNELNQRFNKTSPTYGKQVRAAKKSVKEETIEETDHHFIKQQIEGHRKAAAEAKKRGDHHRAMAHEQQARDYEQHGMSGSRFETLSGSRFETSSGLKYEEVNMDNDTVTEGAKKIKLTPGMNKKDFKAQKTAMKQKVVAKAKKAAATKKAASKPAPAKAAPAADDEDDKMLSRLLKGKLKHGDHPHLAKQIVSKIRTTDVRSRADMQKKIYHAQGDELHNLLKH